MTDRSGGSFLDRAKGKVKEVAGSVFGNDTLAHEGRLEQEKATAADQAADQAQGADLLAEQADVEAAKQHNAVERQRVEAEQLEVARAAQVERDKAAAEQKVEAEFAGKEQAERQRQAAQEQAVANQDLAADRQRAADAAEVVASATEADRAVAAAEHIDDLRPGN